jgi:very-short-patch-repair endonuclease
MSEDKAQMWAYYWNLFSGDEPRMTPEFEFDKHLGRKHRFDWAHIGARVAVEIDGGQWSAGGGRHAKDADREKLNIAASLRWLVFRFSPDQLKRDPEGCVRLVLMAIQDSK